jgi:beta-galactosidase
MAYFRGISRRRFIALSGAVAAHAATAHGVATAPVRRDVQSLAGTWRFSLDRDDSGVKQGWFTRNLDATTRIALPGILQAQGYGDDISVDTPWVAALPRDMRWYLLPQYAAYTRPGHVLVPYLSQPVKHYLGVAWYQRDVVVPAGWKGKRTALHLERTRWQTTVYLDEKEMGECHSLVAPHDFDLGLMAPGTHRLSIRIDNRMILPYRPDGHSVSDGEAGTWNGVIGKIELSATSPVWIDDAQVFPNVEAKSARIKVRVGNATGEAGAGTLAVGATTAPVSWDASGGDGEIEIALPKAMLWSEFTPVLQRVTLKLSGPSADDHRELVFGMREIKADGKRMLLNGEPFNFRATHDGGGFPLTGHPAMDVAAWKRIISTCKEWGLNGMRFHSWCPPDAAFTAADELGFYMQPECGMWNSFDTEGKMMAVLQDETARLLKAYGNHPSMVLLNATNEPAGHYQEQMPAWDHKWREADPRRLYADGTGRPSLPAPGQPYPADYIVSLRNGRGPSGYFGGDYEASMRETPVPCVGHEVGQWAAYPDFDVMKKFTGYLKPGNYEIMRDSAEAHGLLKKNKALAHASGRFQVVCYKEELEAMERTPSYSGFALLDLHDYLGQGGALIGLLDAFWESKNYVTAAEFRQFNNSTIPLARLKDRVYTTGDTLTAEVEVAHFGPAALTAAKSRWRIVDGAGKRMAGGEFAARDVPKGKGTPLGKVTAELGKLAAPAMYKLVVELDGGAGTKAAPFINEWKFWMYPAVVEEVVPPAVLVTSVWPEAEAKLAAGGKVLFAPAAADLDSTDPKMSTVPIFWNRLMNPNGTWFLGMWVDAAHPALKGFPTEANCDWHWIDLAGSARALSMGALPKGLEPIVQPIDDWNRNWKLGLMYECAVGAGRLMVCSVDLEAKRPGAATLRRSLMEYMASERFKPAVQVAAADLRGQWLTQRPDKVDPGAEQKAQPTSPDLQDPGQIRRKPGA